MKDLMQPRYKVIADYPLSDKYFKIGDILIWVEAERCYYGDNCRLHKETVESYPHIFKRLEWWEERTIDEMPEYVKDYKGRIFKVIEWDIHMPYVYVDKVLHDPNNEEWVDVVKRAWLYGAVFPATEQEYTNYKNQQQ